jgi:hypothetical protein
MAGVRTALVVATGTYEDSSLRELRAPVHDTEAFVRVLRDPAIGDFRVNTLIDQPAYVINEEIEGFFDDRTTDDLLLLYFSCHGVKDPGGRLYFATTTTKLRRLGATAVSSVFVNEQMERSRSRRIVLLLDCCYSGAFTRGLVPKGGVGIELPERFEGRGRVVITASSAMEYAFEGGELSVDDGSPSIFTSAVVRGLQTGAADRDGDGLVSVDELYGYVYDQVIEATPDQTPGMFADVRGEVFVARNPRVPARDGSGPAAEPGPDAIETVERPGIPPQTTSGADEVLSLPQGDGGILAVAFSPDARLVTAGDDGAVRLFELDRGREVATIAIGEVGRAVTLSRDGGSLAAGDWGNQARVWHLASRSEIASVRHAGLVRSVALSPDGRRLATGSEDRTARVWDIESGRELVTIPHPGLLNWVLAVAFDPDGTRLATGSLLKTARVLDAASGRELASLRHADDVCAVTFSPDGRLLATGSDDGTARIWQAASGQETARLQHGSRVSALAFSPDGRLLATGSDDGTARVWAWAARGSATLGRGGD